MGLAALHPDTAESCDAAVAERPGGAAGQSPGHPTGGKRCSPQGAAAPQGPPAPAGDLPTPQRKS